MSEVRSQPLIETECPACGYYPLHRKTTPYNHHFIISYLCTVCGHAHDAEHGARGEAFHPDTVVLHPQESILGSVVQDPTNYISTPEAKV